LEYLEEANLFLIPLDGQRRWYRYHPLFADCLRAELPVQERTLGHRRAASWFSANGDYGEAISHAAAAGDEEEVARLVALAAEPALQQGEVARLAGWMAQLPETRLLSDPRLAIYYLLCLILTGRSQEAPAALERVEKGSGEWQDSRQRARLLALKAWVADITDSPARGKLAHEAAAAIGDDDPFFKALIAIPLGHAHTFEDRLGEAVRTFRAGLDAAQQPGVSFARLSLMSNVVHALNLQGRRLEALAVCRQALETFQDARGSPSPPAGLPMLLRGWLSYQAGDLDQAHLDLTQARELMKTAFGDTLLTPLQFELPALLQQAAGEGARALATARQGLQRAQQQRYRQAVRAATRLEADLHLRQGHLDPVRQWAADLPIRLGAQAEALWPAGEPVYDLAYLTFARLLIATDRHQDASRLLAELAAFARAGERGSSLITILLLQALLVPDPEALLVEALQRADAEGYLQTVLDECTYPAHGAQLSALLQRTTVHRAAPAFVTQLWQRTGETPAKLSEATNEALPEPLTEQELIVLQHLVSGRSNREIAEELVITVGTAKWHVHNVYGKLGVGNRLDAVLRAQELGLV
jgi:LuxR family maltose regulon positive regulatory protein